MEKINIYYLPDISEEEKKIFREVFKENELQFSEYKVKGILWGSFDLQVIIDFLNNPAVNAAVTGGTAILLIHSLIKRIFQRNRNKIEDNNTRPRYTNLVFRMKKKNIVISNANDKNEIMISRVSTEFSLNKTEKYSEEKLEEYIKED